MPRWYRKAGAGWHAAYCSGWHVFPHQHAHIKAQHTWTAAEMTKCLISSLECLDEVSGLLRTLVCSCAPRRTLIIQRGWHLQRIWQPVRRMAGWGEGGGGLQWPHLAIHPRDEVSPGSDQMGEEAFVERTVMICGHLCQRMDSILPMGNVPRIHMVDGLLMSSGYPVPVSILPNEQKQKEALGLTCCCSGPGGVSLISSSPSCFPAHHLLGQMSTADKVSFTKISRARSLPPQSGVSGCGTWWRWPRGTGVILRENERSLQPSGTVTDRFPSSGPRHATVH